MRYILGADNFSALFMGWANKQYLCSSWSSCSIASAGLLGKRQAEDFAGGGGCLAPAVGGKGFLAYFLGPGNCETPFIGQAKKGGRYIMIQNPEVRPFGLRVLHQGLAASIFQFSGGQFHREGEETTSRFQTLYRIRIQCGAGKGLMSGNVMVLVSVRL